MVPKPAYRCGGSTGWPLVRGVPVSRLTREIAHGHLHHVRHVRGTHRGAHSTRNRWILALYGVRNNTIWMRKNVNPTELVRDLDDLANGDATEEMDPIPREPFAGGTTGLSAYSGRSAIARYLHRSDWSRILNFKLIILPTNQFSIRLECLCSWGKFNCSIHLLITCHG